MTKYQRLKIASDVLDQTLEGFAREWQCSMTTVRGVCDGSITSARVSHLIDEKIALAEKKFATHLKNKAVIQ